MSTSLAHSRREATAREASLLHVVSNRPLADFLDFLSAGALNAAPRYPVSKIIRVAPFAEKTLQGRLKQLWWVPPWIKVASIFSIYRILSAPRPHSAGTQNGMCRDGGRVPREPQDARTVGLGHVVMCLRECGFWGITMSVPCMVQIDLL